MAIFGEDINLNVRTEQYTCLDMTVFVAMVEHSNKQT